MFPSLTSFFFPSHGHHRDLHSFPTRRSSDLLNSEFITFTPRSTVIWMARFQYRTAAWRSSSSGPDHRYSGSTERSEEHTSELQSRRDLVCRLLLEKKKKKEPS